MKLLLAQMDGLFPPEHGAAKVNRLLMEALAARGHSCRIVVPFHADDVLPEGQSHFGQSLSKLKLRGIPFSVSTAGTVKFRHQGVDYQGPLMATGRLVDYLWMQLRSFAPDRVFVNDGGKSYGTQLLERALDACPSGVVYIAQTVHYLPFGPLAKNPDAAATELLRRAVRVLAVSDYVRDYMAQWAGLEATTVRFPVYGNGPFSRSDGFRDGLVTMINPCAWKGLSIFLGLARTWPHRAFGAVPTWGTSGPELSELAGLPNVQILQRKDAIDDVLAHTSVLLVPSLWFEAFGLVCVEAMLRGIPTLASDVGGLPEAKLGVNYILPVKPLEFVREPVEALAGSSLRVHVPKQDLDPWSQALEEVLGDAAQYESVANASREAALEFVSRTRWEHVEELLLA